MPDSNVVETHPVRVRIFMRNGAKVSGLAHIQPGGYRKRISDVLNLGQIKYIAVTDGTYDMDGESTHTQCMLVNVADISIVDATPPLPEDLGKSEPLLGSGSSAGSLG